MPTRRALVVFAEGNDLHVIESLRRRFDPLAGVIAAHVTLVFPFASEIPDAALRSHIERALQDQQPFRVRFEGVDVVEDEYLFLEAVMGRERLVELHDRLYQGVLAEHRSSIHEYRPHITLGRIRDGVERNDALIVAREVSPALDWIVRGVSVFRLDDEDGHRTDEVRMKSR